MIRFATLLLGCLLTLFCPELLAQNNWQRTPVLSLPKVADEWVERKQFENNPQAEAVILYDRGELHFDAQLTRLRLLYHYQRVVKVFSEDAAEQFREVHISVNPNESIVEVLAIVHRKYTDGAKVVKIKVGRDKIEEQVFSDGHREYIIRFPQVAPGTVISYAYACATENYSRLRPWNFQHALPVQESHFVSYVPGEFKLLALLQGEGRNFAANEGKLAGRLYFKPIRNAQLEPRIQASPTGFGTPTSILATDYSMTNLPALQLEPLVGTQTDLQVRLLFQLQGMKLPHHANAWAGNWEELLLFMEKHSQLGYLTKGRQAVKNWLKEQGIETPEKPNKAHLEKVILAVQQDLKWNERFDVLGSKTTRELTKSGSGNSADVNLFLAAVLNFSGYKTTPLLACTRLHGRLLKKFPVLAQFDHVMLEVKLKGKTIQIDASQPSLKFGQLPVNILRNEALRLSPRKVSWVKLDRSLIRNRHTFAFFDLDPRKGIIKGKLRHRDRGYSAVQTQARIARYEDNAEQYITDEMLAEFPLASLEHHTIKTEVFAGEEAVYTRAELITRDYITQGDSLILIDPLLSESYPFNPLAQADRSAPIDFGSPIREEFVLMLTIPQGYEFVVVPDEIGVALPFGHGSFVYKYLIVNNTLQLLSRIKINRAEFPPNYHKSISAFFDYIAAKHGEKIIVRKVK